MRLLYAAVFAVLCLIVAGCAEPVPQARASYVGDWQAKNMRLRITADGHVSYERREGNTSRSINAPIRGFDGDNFSVGIGPFSTTFVVTSPPKQHDGVWKMTVDGVELTRRAGAAGDLRPV